MAINTGVNVSNYSAAAFLVVNPGVNVSNYSAGAFLTVNPGVNVSNYSSAAFLANSNVNPPVWPFLTFPDGVVNLGYSQSWDLTPAAPPVTYTLFSGSLPPGLSLSSGPADIGTISGVPTTVGIYTFQLKATNTYGSAVSPTLSITIVAVAGLSNYAWVS